MAIRPRKLPRDPNERAAYIAKLSTGEIEAEADPRNPAAVARGELGGAKGGPARAAKLTPERKREIAQQAAAKRWSPRKP